jgi:hypothetical protein
MGNILFYLVIILLTQVPPTTSNIEQAFLQNEPNLLYSYFPENTKISISLPDPIAFSDLISNHQAFFLFKKIFASFPSFEFYSVDTPLFFNENQCIYQARWSFKNKRNNNQYGFHIFFYMVKVEDINDFNANETWIISEIKAEKI